MQSKLYGGENTSPTAESSVKSQAAFILGICYRRPHLSLHLRPFLNWICFVLIQAGFLTCHDLSGLWACPYLSHQEECSTSCLSISLHCPYSSHVPPASLAMSLISQVHNALSFQFVSHLIKNTFMRAQTHTRAPTHARTHLLHLCHRSGFAFPRR